MDRATPDGHRPDKVRDISPPPAPGDDHVVVFPSLRAPGESPEHRTQYVSDAEIAQLVSIALEDALAVLGQSNPETRLRLRAYEARAGIREVLLALPKAKARDEQVLREYRRAMVLQNLALELALNLVDSIRRYARIYEREIPARFAWRRPHRRREPLAPPLKPALRRPPGRTGATLALVRPFPAEGTIG